MRRALLAIVLCLVAGDRIRAADRAPVVVDLNSATPAALAELPGLSEEMARAIVAWRVENGPFALPEDVLRVPGMEAVFEALEPRLRALPPPSGTAVGDTAGIIALPGFYGRFDGVDLDALPPDRRQEFLTRVNHEMCICGCQGDTIARCYVTDPACPLAKARLKTLYKQVLEASRSD